MDTRNSVSPVLPLRAVGPLNLTKMFRATAVSCRGGPSRPSRGSTARVLPYSSGQVFSTLRSWKRRYTARLRGTAKSECGASLVELALLLPLLMLMFLGVVEIGRMFYVSIEVNNAARAGAAYGAQSNITAGDIAGMESVAQQDAPDVPGLTATASYSCACSTAAGAITSLASCTDVCAAGDHQIVFVSVYTSASFTTLSHFPGLPTPFTTYGKAVMRVSQ
jgi:Flp pilus assembly protein TadG